MTAKIIDADGKTIFEFDSESAMRAMLLRLVSQAKFGEFLKPEFTLNENVNALARAILIHAAEAGHTTISTHDGFYPGPPQGWTSRPTWLHEVVRLIFDNAPQYKWWTLDHKAKAEIVKLACFPHRPSQEAIEDSVGSVDFWVENYRKD
jgi:hypothetical protein